MMLRVYFVLQQWLNLSAPGVERNALRAGYCPFSSSGDSEAYWDFHKDQVLKRSHSSPIKNCLPLEAA